MNQNKIYLFGQKITIFLLIIFSTFGQNFAQTATPAKSVLSAEEKALADKITVETIKDVTTKLSADEMEGRGTMQPGGDKAANWIADRFKQLGLKPLGDKDSYLQKVEFKETVSTAETSFTIGEEKLVAGTDYGYLPMDSGNKEISGEMVFVAFGMQVPALNRDDLFGVNVTGKVVVLLNGPPANISKESWEQQQASTIFIGNLIRKGVAAIVFIGHGREQNPPDKYITYFARRQITTPDEQGYPSAIPQFVYVSSNAAEKLFAKSGVTVKDALAQAEQNNFKPIELKQKAKIVAKYKSTKGFANNVIGYIEGSDPNLKAEAVVFTAHYDAYGIENGKIYAGAADNALGTAEMLAVAEAFSKTENKPKRSLIFLSVTGEEYGLYGSKYWAKKPTWDIKKVAANLNLDGVGTEVWGAVKTMVGYGAEYSTLGAVMEDISSAMGIKVVPDPAPEEKIFTRSDHYSFVERGIPALKLMGAPEGDIQMTMKRKKEWEKTDYHQPGDVIKPDWAWDGAETVAEIMGIMGLRIANGETMPSWLPDSRFGKLERGNTKKLPEE